MTEFEVPYVTSLLPGEESELVIEVKVKQAGGERRVFTRTFPIGKPHRLNVHDIPIPNPPANEIAVAWRFEPVEEPNG